METVIIDGQTYHIEEMNKPSAGAVKRTNEHINDVMRRRSADATIEGGAK